jgi:hypothetical protein
VKRNFLLLLPGANLVAIVLESRTVLSDPQDQRLGDRLAQTQVVEGAGAKDLVKSFQDWLMNLGDALADASGRRRRRVPGRIDRAARNISDDTPLVAPSIVETLVVDHEDHEGHEDRAFVVSAARDANSLESSVS